MTYSQIVVLAEISDKVPTQWMILLFGIVFGIPIYFAARHAWSIIAWIQMAIFALISYGMFKELYFDKYIRKSIIAELGLNYIVLMIATCFIPVVFGAVGFIRKRNAANNRFERTGYPRHVGCLRTRRAAVRPSAQP